MDPHSYENLVISYPSEKFWQSGDRPFARPSELGMKSDAAGTPFCKGSVTLLAGPTFLHINTLARVNSVKERHLAHAQALLIEAKRLIFSHM